MQSHKVVNRKYSVSNQIAERPLSKKKFAALLQSLQTMSAAEFAALEVAPPSKEGK
jgi:hypothetical protein